MTDLTAHFTERNNPATEAQVAEFIAAVGLKPPADYLAFMRSHNGAYGEGANPVFMYSLDECLERTRTAEGLPPKMVVFASDGGGVQYLFDGRGKSLQIVELGMNDDVADARKLGDSLEKALAKLRATQQKAEAQLLKKSKLPPLPDLQPGQHGEVTRLALHPERFFVCDIAFSKDGSHVAISGNFGIQVWSVNAWRRAASVLDAEGELPSMGKVHLDAANHRVISAHREHLLITDYMTRKRIDSFQLPQSSNRTVFSEDGRQLAQHSDGGVLILTDLVSRHEIGRESIRVTIRRLDDSLLLGHTPDAQMVVWDTKTGKRLHEFPRPEQPGQMQDIDQCCSVPGDRLFIGGKGGTCQVVDLASKQVTPVLIEGLRDQAVHLVERVGAGSRILVATDDAVHVVDSENWSIIATFDTFQPGCAPARLWPSPDGRWLLTSGSRSVSYAQFAVRVWRLP